MCVGSCENIAMEDSVQNSITPPLYYLAFTQLFQLKHGMPNDTTTTILFPNCCYNSNTARPMTPPVLQSCLHVAVLTSTPWLNDMTTLQFCLHAAVTVQHSMPSRITVHVAITSQLKHSKPSDITALQPCLQIAVSSTSTASAMTITTTT